MSRHPLHNHPGRVHPTAQVDPCAQLGPGVEVGPYAIIGADVVIGERTSVGSHCVIEGSTTIGRNNRIFNSCSIGAESQDKKSSGASSRLIIGDNNTIREFCTLNGSGGVTRIGDRNWIMAYVHVAHDCVVGNDVTLTNAVQLAGHVEVEDWAVLGGLTGVHQHVRIGAHAMIGASSMVTRDVPPMALALGAPARSRGINRVGLSRRGFDDEAISLYLRLHAALYRSGSSPAEVRAELAAVLADHPCADMLGHHLLDFVERSERGLIGAARGHAATPARATWLDTPRAPAPRPLSVAEIAERTGGTLTGDAERLIAGVESLEHAGPEHLSWANSARFRTRVTASQAGAVLVPAALADAAPTTIVCADVDAAIETMLRTFQRERSAAAPSIHPTAVVDDRAELGEDVTIGPHASIGPDAKLGHRTTIGAGCHVGAGVVLGEDVTLWPGAVIYADCTLGDRVVLHANAVVGVDGYGYRRATDGTHHHFPHVGTVVLEDDVEVYANAVVARAKVGATVVGRGTKIGHQSIVAHGVQTGADCLIVTHAAIAGSAVLERGVTLAGKAAVVPHRRIAEGAVVGANSTVLNDLPDRGLYTGTPARPHAQTVERHRSIARLPELVEQVRELEARLAELEGRAPAPARVPTSDPTGPARASG